MSLELVRSSSQYAYYDLAATPSTPLVFGLKLKLTSIVDDHAVFGAYHVATGYSGYHIRIRNSDDAIFADSAQQPTFDASYRTGLATATWHTVIAVWSAANNRIIYLDDVASTANVTSITVTAAVRLALGAYYAGSGAAGFLDGKVAEVFQLNAVPSGAERTAFHNGDRPSDIWSTSLVRYWPLVSDLVDDVLGNTLTTSGSPSLVGDHPTMNGAVSVTPATATLTLTTFAPTVSLLSFEEALSDESDSTYVELVSANSPSTFEVTLAEAQQPGSGAGTLTIRAERLEE
jgi:hypothetical protein